VRGVSSAVAFEGCAGGVEGVAVELEDDPLGKPDGVGLEAFDLVVEGWARELGGAEKRGEQAFGA
jgi:hypothetical protein